VQRHHNQAFIKLMQSLHAEENRALAPFSTLRVGGPARFFLLANSLSDIMLVQKACREHQINMHILSGGSNTLFSDEGFLGLVLKLGPAFDYIKPGPAQALLVGAATTFAKLTKLSVNMGFEKAVGWAGTPGLVGGAIRMNAGTRMGEVSDGLSRVNIIHDGELKSFNKKDIDFSYRHCGLAENTIITSAEFFYAKENLGEPNKLIQQVKAYQVKRKLSQPSINSAGSFFKNPYPEFAGALIEKANLKGKTLNGAQISQLHANFIINRGGAKADDIIALGSLAQKTVFNSFGLVLRPEIRYVGERIPTLFAQK
jgi:UDP-N-acetylmuramate dehydrogenase